MGGWVRIPLFLGGFFVLFLFNGGTSMFKKKPKKSRYGLGGVSGGDEGDEGDRGGASFSKPAYSLSAGKYGQHSVNSASSSRAPKDKTMDDLRDVGNELERLHKL
jgi:hypothetical protein